MFKKQRDSNLETLRILAMMAIIAHHYVVCSSVTCSFNYENPTTQQYFLTIWGMWGKTAINSFVLISGFFLCKGTLTWQRWVKLFMQILFYKIFITLVFTITGYEPITIKNIVRPIAYFLKNINGSFAASFIAFYAFVPIYNKIIISLNNRQHLFFICGLLTIFTIADTFFMGHAYNEPVWFMTLYMVAAYIRLYPNKYTESLTISTLFLTASIIVAVTSVIILTYIGRGYIAYFFVSDSDKILAFGVGLSAFLVAKNSPMFHNRIINFLSAGTFAVYLIHDAYDSMRHWLWEDVCQVPRMLTADMSSLVLHAVVIPPIIFIMCSSIDWIRRRYIETFFMKWLNSISDKYYHIVNRPSSASTKHGGTRINSK